MLQSPFQILAAKYLLPSALYSLAVVIVIKVGILSVGMISWLFDIWVEVLVLVFREGVPF